MHAGQYLVVVFFEQGAEFALPANGLSGCCHRVFVALVQIPATKRPGVKIDCGSNCALIACIRRAVAPTSPQASACNRTTDAACSIIPEPPPPTSLLRTRLI